MEFILNKKQICKDPYTCPKEWDKLRKEIKNKEYPISLNYLDGISGTVPFNSTESNNYGAVIVDLNQPKPANEILLKAVVDNRWLGQKQERTFLNNTKRLNEPPVKTYRELALYSIPQNNYESVLDMYAESVPYSQIKLPEIPNLVPGDSEHPFPYIKEGFGCNIINDKLFKTLSFVIIILFFIFIISKININKYK